MSLQNVARLSRLYTRADVQFAHVLMALPPAK